MLKVKRIMCLLSLIFLFNTYDISTITPFHALATEVVEDTNIEMVHNNNDNNIRLIGNPTIIKLETIVEKAKEEKLKMEKKKEEEEKKKENEPQWKEFILTFYTSLEYENSSAGPVTCQNKPLVHGGVANNVIPQNTKLYLAGYGQVIVNDKGSDKYFSVDNRLDVFIEREPGESNKQYSKRVNDYGIQKVWGYIIK